MKISKEIKIGITAIVAVAIIYFGIIFLKGLRLFSSENVYYVNMTDVGGLSKSAEIMASGMNIGKVKDIHFNRENRIITVALEINEGFTIPANSYATITKEMLGAPKMNIVMGPDPRQILSIGDTILGHGGNSDLMSAAGSMLPKIEAMLPKVDSILTAINTLTNDPALMAALKNLEATSANLSTSTAGLSELMADVNGNVPQILTSARKSCSDFEQVANQIGQIDVQGMERKVNTLMDGANTAVTELNGVTSTLNERLSSSNSTIGKLMNDASVYDRLDSTMNNASRLLEDLRLHPKRYVHFSLFGKKDK